RTMEPTHLKFSHYGWTSAKELGINCGLDFKTIWFDGLNLNVLGKYCSTHLNFRHVITSWSFRIGGGRKVKKAPYAVDTGFFINYFSIRVREFEDYWVLLWNGIFLVVKNKVEVNG